MGKKTGIRFFRWIKSDLPDCDPNPVLLLSVTKLNTSTTATPQTSSTLSLQRPHTIFYDRTPIVPDTFDADDNNLPPNKSQLYDIKKRCDSYIDKIPEILENKKIIKNSKLILNNNSGKIGQTTSSSSSSIALPLTQKLDRNSNGNQSDSQEHQTTPKSSSLEYSKNKNLTKTDNNNDKNITDTTKAASGGAHTVLKPKVLITRIKKSSDKIIENIIIDDYNNIKSTTTSNRNTNKKSSNCKIYNFIPKCTRRNDSTEPESLSSEETNNNLELNKTPTNNKLFLNSKNSYNSSVIMDRSVDSIGSCSLDVDADSTDFSDTSGSLNLVTPSSGKDINKEFIARFQERCQIVPQTTTTILDPCSGKVTTVLSSPVTDLPATIKKPSYLNLACCVNGYSNLTTYDSKLRQNINKSREVSPIRPITHSLHYNRESGNNYLVVPVPLPIRIDPPTMDSSEPHRSYMSTEKRIFTSQMLNDNNGSAGGIGGKDVVDDASSTTRYKSTFKTTSKYVTTSNSTIKISSETDTPTKSFIQQSVERLYGPGALATLYTHKRGHLNNNNNNSNNNHSNNNGHLTDGNGNLNGSNILAEKYLNNINSSQHHDNNIYLNYTATKLNGHSTLFQQHHYENNENIKNSRDITTTTSISTTPAAIGTIYDPQPPSSVLVSESLPVLRHLRPEFRAQLPISPKKSMTTRVSNSNTELSSLNNNVHNNNNNKLITPTATTQSTTSSPNNTSPTIMMTKEISNSAVVVVEKTKNGILFKNDDNDDDDNNHELNNKIKIQKNIEINKNMFSCNQANGGDVIAHKNHINQTNNSNDNNLTEKKVLIMDDNNDTILLNNNNNNINNNNNNLKLNGDNNIIINNGDSCDDKDGNYFLLILKDKQSRLIELADQTEKDIEDLAESSDVSDEILGYLRSASGKARLLATKKMKQFEGLCHSNLNLTPEGEFPTTSADLQGFWDMVMLQVNHVDSLFKEIESWKANNWKKPVIAEIAPPQGTKLPKRPIPLKTSKQNGTSKSEAAALAAQKREAQRKQLAEIRRQNKTKLDQQQQLERQQQQENGVEIFIAGGSTS